MNKEKKKAKSVSWYALIGGTSIGFIIIVGITPYIIKFLDSQLYTLNDLNVLDTNKPTLIEPSIALFGILLGTLLTAITIIFVYKTYQAQREQIEEQQKELAENAREKEFNRIIDIFYKQIDYTLSRLSDVNFDYIKISKGLKGADYSTIVANIKTITDTVRTLYCEELFYSELLEKSNLSDYDKGFAYNIFTRNIPQYISFLTMDLNNFYTKEGDNGHLEDIFNIEITAIKYKEYRNHVGTQENFLAFVQRKIAEDYERLKEIWTEFTDSAHYASQIRNRVGLYRKSYDTLAKSSNEQ